MKRIIVATDLSKASKAGLKFAIQFASQHHVHLIFFHAIELLIPTRWNDVKAKIRMDEEIKLETDNLLKFVLEIYKESKKRPSRFDCMVRYGAPVSQAILEFAAEVKASYICISTRGAGPLRKVIGTHTSAVIKKSPVPVFAIPAGYKPSAIKNILYASDLTALRNELRVVKVLAGKLRAPVSVVHYDYFLNPKISRQAFEKLTNLKSLAGTAFHLEKFNWEQTMSWHLKRAGRKYKPDIIALFTAHGRPWFQRWFRRSISAEVSFDSVKPLLIYPKK